jgi:predicted ester cyclase
MDDIKPQLERFYEEVVNGGKLDLIDELLTEDFVENEPFPGLGTDRASVRRFFEMAQGSFEGLRMEIDAIYVDGNTGIVRSRMQGKHVGEFMGIPATDRKVDVPLVDIIEFNDEGLATSHWGVMDGAELMTQLGVIGDEAQPPSA